MFRVRVSRFLGVLVTGFRVFGSRLQGFRLLGLGFRAFGFRAEGLGFLEEWSGVPKLGVPFQDSRRQGF